MGSVDADNLAASLQAGALNRTHWTNPDWAVLGRAAWMLVARAALIA